MEAESPFVIGIVGENVFGDDLSQAIAGERVNNHMVVIRKVDTPEKALDCHLVFINSTFDQPQKIIEITAGKPILTVSDRPDFVHEGGMLGMYLDDRQRVKLLVNRVKAEAAGLAISSKLLRVAKIFEE